MRVKTVVVVMMMFTALGESRTIASASTITIDTGMDTVISAIR
jgi:hypothetical protein